MAWEETTMAEPRTLQDLFDAVLLSAFVEVVSAAVAEQGVEIHQWRRDEKARSQEKS
jgi:hypothetical protein